MRLSIKRHLPLLLIVLVGVLLIMSLSGAQSPVFRIGVIDSPQGSLVNGARLAVDEVNARGGVVGADGTRFQLELIVQPPDENGNLQQAVANIQQAAVTAVIGPTQTSVTLDNLNRLQTLNVPVLVAAIGDTILASDGTDRLFRARAAEVYQGRALASYMTADLELSRITTVQLDISSTAGVVGFTTAASAFGAQQQIPVLFEQGETIEDLVQEVFETSPQAVVIYGEPEVAAQVVTGLRANGFGGIVAYNRAEDSLFRSLVSLQDLEGILATATWSVASHDLRSAEFVLDYVRGFNAVPDEFAAAGYDAVQIIAEGLTRPGNLVNNLGNLEVIQGVQGLLTPSRFTDGELSDNVQVLEINRFGGSRLLARYVNEQRVEDEEELVIATPTLAPTSTPEGVVLTVLSQVLNVRTGPSTNYDVIGQLRQGDQVRVVGANTDFSWAVIEFRGQQAWVSTASNLAEVFGNLRTVPLVQAPPTPTPRPPTPTQPPADRPDVVVLSASPKFIPWNTAFNVDVVIQNVGGANAGPFAVAASFEPLGAAGYDAENFSGLASQALQSFQLSVPPIPQTGNFESAIVADLNNQLNEGTGEDNNVYSFTYKVDRSSVTNVSTLGIGAGIDLDGGGGFDLIYTASGLQTSGACTGTANCIGLLSPALNWDTAHYDAVSSTFGINTGQVLNIALVPGTTIGVLTNTGARVVLRVDSVVPGVSVSFTYRRYV